MSVITFLVDSSRQKAESIIGATTHRNLLVNTLKERRTDNAVQKAQGQKVYAAIHTQQQTMYMGMTIVNNMMKESKNKYENK